MAFINWLMTKLNKEPAKTKQTPYINYVISGYTEKHAGVDVNFDSAMRHADVYTAIKIIAESISSIPMELYRIDGSGVKEKVSAGNRYRKILCEKPNDYMTSQELIEYLITALLLRGNSFLHIVENNLGTLMELVPLRYFNAVNLEMDTHGIPYATWATNDAKTMTSYAPLYKDNLFHIKLQTVDGFRGLSPIYQMAENIGVAIAEKRHTSKTFENGARLSGVLSTEDTLDEDAAGRLNDNWNAAYGGPNNTGKVAVLEHGLKYESITMSNHDAQLLELMNFSREQIAAMYRLPVQMLNSTDAQTYNNVEQNQLQFLKGCLMPLITRLEHNFNLILPDNLIVKFDTTQFTRGDISTQATVAESLIKNGIISHEESREMFDYAPNNDDGTFVIQSNNYTWGKWSELEEMKAMEREQQSVALDGSKIANDVAKNPPPPQQAAQGDKKVKNAQIHADLMTLTPAQIGSVINYLRSLNLPDPTGPAHDVQDGIDSINDIIDSIPLLTPQQLQEIQRMLNAF